MFNNIKYIMLISDSLTNQYRINWILSPTDNDTKHIFKFFLF